MKNGIIEFRGGTIACFIRSQSETGASLEIVGPVPAQFALLIADERIECSVIWRIKKLIGVKFESSIDLH